MPERDRDVPLLFHEKKCENYDEYVFKHNGYDIHRFGDWDISPRMFIFDHFIVNLYMKIDG